MSAGLLAVMKALVPAGRPDALVALADTRLPEPQPGEALVKVEAFSVNRGEIFQLEQPRPGTRPGQDIAGLVVQAAADGTGPAAGERVVGHPEAGGWAEYAAVPTAALAPLPDSVPAVPAAARPLAGLTALRLLRSAGSVAGRRIMLTGERAARPYHSPGAPQAGHSVDPRHRRYEDCREGFDWSAIRTRVHVWSDSAWVGTRTLTTNLCRSARCADGARGCPRDARPGYRCVRTYR